MAKIEARQRRVDVDDLFALAAALNIPLAALLLPEVGEFDQVQLTRTRSTESWAIWAWIEGRCALPDDMDATANPERDLQFLEARPGWQKRHEREPLTQAVAQLVWRTNRTVGALLAGQKWAVKRWAKSARSSLRVVRDELDIIDKECADEPR